MKVLKYCLKPALFTFVYVICMDLISIGVSYIGGGSKETVYVVLQLVLSIVSILFYCFIVGVINFKEGEEALDFRHTNDLQRMRMIETGKPVAINSAPEYKPYKGFLTGLIASAPLIIMMIVHLILGLSTGGTANGAGIAATFAYFVFSLPYMMFHSATIVWGQYFIILYSVIILCLSTGVPYILGAKKSQKKYDKMEALRRAIHGEDK